MNLAFRTSYPASSNLAPADSPALSPAKLSAKLSAFSSRLNGPKSADIKVAYRKATTNLVARKFNLVLSMIATSFIMQNQPVFNHSLEEQRDQMNRFLGDTLEKELLPVFRLSKKKPKLPGLPLPQLPEEPEGSGRDCQDMGQYVSHTRS